MTYLFSRNEVRQREGKRERVSKRKGDCGGEKKQWMMYVDYGQVIDINLAASKTVEDRQAQSVE